MYFAQFCIDIFGEFLIKLKNIQGAIKGRSVGVDYEKKSLLASEISLMYIINNRGPNIEPCVIPVIILFCVDATFLNSTYCFRSVK